MVHGTQVAATFTLGRPSQEVLVVLRRRVGVGVHGRGVPRAADEHDPLVVLAGGADGVRIAASRSASSRPASTPAPGRRGPQLGHGVADGVEGVEAVVAVLDGVLPPALGVVEAGGARRATAIGSVTRSTVDAGVLGARRRRRSVDAVGQHRGAAGRSAKRTGTPRASAQRSATHSGEKAASG